MIRCYTTNHSISRTVMHAFAEGCEGQIVPPSALLPGEAAMYGILRGTGAIIKKCERLKRRYHYLDHGYIGRGHYEGYYRVAVNGRQTIIDLNEDWPADRFESLGVPLKPWRKSGSFILIAPLTDAVARFCGLDAEKWLHKVTRSVAAYTDRHIMVKPKDGGDIKEALEDCWCVVTHSSNCAVDALLEGVPVITLGESAASPISWTLANIESPDWPDRENWIHGLAYHQWTLTEMRRGQYMRFHERMRVAA